MVISKTDVAGNEIAGAKIEVWSAGTDGRMLESWTSVAGESKTIQLAAGDYVFKETVAPEGFKVVSDITFTVDANGTVTTTDVKQTADGKQVATAKDGKLTVINEAKKTDVNPDTSSTPSKPQAGKKPLAITGAQVGTLTLLAGALMAGGVVLVSRRKRS